MNRNNEKVFPFLFSKLSSSFDFNECNFKLSKDKEGTARIVVFKDLGISNSYTLESSFCGATMGPFADYHFTPGILRQVGIDFCRTLHMYNDKDERNKAKLEINMKFPPPPKDSK